MVAASREPSKYKFLQKQILYFIFCLHRHLAMAKSLRIQGGHIIQTCYEEKYKGEVYLPRQHFQIWVKPSLASSRINEQATSW